MQAAQRSMPLGSLWYCTACLGTLASARRGKPRPPRRGRRAARRPGRSAAAGGRSALRRADGGGRRGRAGGCHDGSSAIAPFTPCEALAVCPSMSAAHPPPQPGPVDALAGLRGRPEGFRDLDGSCAGGPGVGLARPGVGAPGGPRPRPFGPVARGGGFAMVARSVPHDRSRPPSPATVPSLCERPR